jgi:hypothetical protein
VVWQAEDDLLARFLPRSGESRDVGRSVGDSALRGPGMLGYVCLAVASWSYERLPRVLLLASPFSWKYM